MFDEGNDQNGNQSDELATRIANMFRAPQVSGQNDDDGDFVNRSLALRVDPATGTAYRVQPGQTPPAATGSTQQQTYMPPIQTTDAQGKTLPKYRMGVGQRILATVANFANGFAGNGAAPIHVGPGALNNRYDQDEMFRQNQNEWNEQSVRGPYRNMIDWRTISQDPTSKRWYGRTFAGDKQELGTPPWAGGQTDDADDAPDNSDEDDLPPIGAQVGPVPVKPPSAQQRFGNGRRQKHGY